MFSFLKTLFSKKLKPKLLEDFSGIDKADFLFQSLVTEKKVPGMAVTFLKDGKPILRKGYGYADLEKDTLVDSENTIFRIASISKCITGLALGKMIEDGLMSWDASFYDYVPYYPKKKYDFTIRQLASHTAGIRGYQGKEYALNQPYSIKESIRIFQNDPLVFEPGKGYLYNSFDFVLISLAMQEVSGIPFDQYMLEKVLAPLGMIDTFPPICHAKSVEVSSEKYLYRPRQVQPDTRFYTKTATGFKEATEVDNFYKLAGGGYLSTSEDVAKLGQAILEQRLLKPETYRELFTPQTVNGKSTYYGLGFQVSEDKFGRPFVGHVGSSVGAYSNLFVYPNEKMVISILVNCTDPKVQEILDEAIHSILTNSNV